MASSTEYINPLEPELDLTPYCITQEVYDSHQQIQDLCGFKFGIQFGFDYPVINGTDVLLILPDEYKCTETYKNVIYEFWVCTFNIGGLYTKIYKQYDEDGMCYRIVCSSHKFSIFIWGLITGLAMIKPTYKYVLK